MITVVGQAPSRSSDPARPFDGGRSGANLERLLGPRFRDRCRCVNLVDRWPGSAPGKGDKFKVGRAERAAARALMDGGEPLILCGRNVARAFVLSFAIELKMFDEITFNVHSSRPTRAVVVPHPSGIVLFWNDAAAVSRGSRLVADFLRRSA